jgi:hypothetical protein
VISVSAETMKFSLNFSMTGTKILVARAREQTMEHSIGVTDMFKKAWRKVQCEVEVVEWDVGPFAADSDRSGLSRSVRIDVRK